MLWWVWRRRRDEGGRKIHGSDGEKRRKARTASETQHLWMVVVVAVRGSRHRVRPIIPFSVRAVHACSWQQALAPNVVAQAETRIRGITSLLRAWATVKTPQLIPAAPARQHATLALRIIQVVDVSVQTTSYLQRESGRGASL